MIRYITAIILLITASTAYAKGIVYVEYNRDKIPNITTAAGIASEIIFEEDEIIEYATFGFDAAWESQTVRNHILVFKAKDEQPETNLIVHTNKRDYLFTVTTGNNNWENHPGNSGAAYSVRMVYRDKKSIAALKAQQESSTLRNRNISMTGVFHSAYDYRATPNARDIVPLRMWDNGTLTFIAFAAGAKRGVIYEVDAAGKSHLVNYHTEKNGLLIIHGVHQQMIIRLGDQAVEVRRNTQYGTVENATKTTVEGAQRYDDSDAPTRYRRIQSSDPETPLMPSEKGQTPEYYPVDVPNS